MDNTMKFYLLAEESGWDCSAYAFQYGQSVKQSSAYQILSYNILGARKHLSFKAQAVVKSYEEFKADPLSVKDAFILDSRLNYLALHSFPEYYLNPFAIDPNYNGEVTTLGQLRFDFEGKEVQLNDIILDESVTPEIKKEQVNRQLDYYLQDMNRLISTSQKMIEKRAFSHENGKKRIFSAVMEIVAMVLLNTLLFAILVSSSNNPAIAESLYHPQIGEATSWLTYIYPCLLFLYDLIFVLFHTYKARISEPYNYARRFLSKNPTKVYEDVRKEKQRLYHYISGAINSRIVLNNDIRDFSRLSTSYIDFRAVLDVSSLREKRLYKMLSATYAAILTLTMLTGFIYFLILILGYAFGVTI